MQVKQTKTLEAVFAAGCREARRRHADEVTLDHLFLAILKQEGGHASHLLKRLLKEWELYQIKIRLERELGPVVLPDTPLNISCPDVRFDENALLEQMRMSGPCMVQDPCNAGHLLQVIVDDRSSRSSRILVLYNVTSEKIVSYLGDMPPNEDYYEDMQYLSLLGEENGEHPERLVSGVMRIAVTDGQPAAKDSMLGQFGVDLTNCAAEGKLDPVIGRDAEIERVIQILGRRKKNNPVLIGEAGVGKSAIIEGLALRITQKKVPHALLHKRIFSLDVASLVAGTKYRGQFEERINLLLKELSGSDVILFIDEIHTIVGAGSTQGSLDTANILKPALARGELQTIGATTLDEYRENIESDSALERRFQKVVVEPTTPDQTLQILRNIAPHYERHHKVRYTEEALQACVTLTGRYITDRFFPDKAIDVMDEAGSRIHLQSAREPAELREMETALTDAQRERREAVEALVYEKAASARMREIALRSKLGETRAEWKRSLETNPVEVTAEHIQQVITSITGIPAERISGGEMTRLQMLYDHLARRVVGQQEAVERIARTIRRSRAGLKDENRPIGVFLFVGPTGVGKTLLAKEVSKWLFDEHRGLIRIDMSEYGEKHNVARLIGAPPGYVGYGEGGQLTEAVRRQPYSVVLFDEIEKAHPEVFNSMLQIFDEGHLTDGSGRRVDFRNTIIIMTSNVGSRNVVQKSVQVGYSTVSKSATAVAAPQCEYRKALEQTFAPEFLNRIDDIVLFRTLELSDVERIIELELQGLFEHTRRLGYKVKITDGAKRRLAAMGYESRYGVRSLKRTLMDNVEEPLSTLIIDGKLHEGDTVVVESGKPHGVRIRVA